MRFQLTFSMLLTLALSTNKVACAKNIESQFALDENLLTYIASYQGFKKNTYEDKKKNKVIGIGHILILNTQIQDNKLEPGEIDQYNRNKYIALSEGAWGFKQVDSIVGGNVSLSAKMATALLIEDTKKSIEIVRSIFPEFEQISYPRKCALIDLAFTLGEKEFKGFKKMIAAVNRNDWEVVVLELQNSKWYEQTRSRSKRNVKTIKENRNRYTRYYANDGINEAILNHKENKISSVKNVYIEEMDMVAKFTAPLVLNKIKTDFPNYATISKPNANQRIYEKLQSSINKYNQIQDCISLENLRDKLIGEDGNVGSFIDFYQARNPSFVGGVLSMFNAMISILAQAVCADLQKEDIEKAKAEATVQNTGGNHGDMGSTAKGANGASSSGGNTNSGKKVGEASLGETQIGND